MRLCWVVQEPAVLAAVGRWRLFRIISRVIDNMYGFNSSCSSAGVFAVGRWVTFVAGAIMVVQGLTVLAVNAGGNCSVIYFLSPTISFFFLFISLELMDG